ncbi:MAG: exodeoxyribonuclease III [Myxococcaceae bacterium]|nr:exodeoxyribonuclease III [Myxococcaceae bacterium]
MKIATWNVNSIRARQERLLGWLESTKPDVACLQELKCQEDQVPEAEVKALGYHACWYGQKTYNGVAILSKTQLVDVCKGLGDSVEDPQCRLIGATVNGVRVYSVYAPNGQEVGSPAYRYKLEWYGRLRRFLDAHHRPDEPIVLCGDWNVAPEPIDVHDPVAWEGQTLFSGPERDALKTLCAFGLEDTWRNLHPGEQKFSWWDYRMLAFPKGKGLRIDHIFATAPLAKKAKASEIEREMRKGKQPSDHAPVWTDFDV